MVQFSKPAAPLSFYCQMISTSSCTYCVVTNRLGFPSIPFQEKYPGIPKKVFGTCKCPALDLVDISFVSAVVQFVCILL